jgi:hypothetical protein
MAKVFAEITTSLDGFVAGPNASLEEPLGAGGELLLHVAPVLLGGGVRLFEAGHPRDLELRASSASPTGVVHVRYATG